MRTAPGARRRAVSLHLETSAHNPLHTLFFLPFLSFPPPHTTPLPPPPSPPSSHPFRNATRARSGFDGRSNVVISARSRRAASLRQQKSSGLGPYAGAGRATDSADRSPAQGGGVAVAACYGSTRHDSTLHDLVDGGSRKLGGDRRRPTDTGNDDDAGITAAICWARRWSPSSRDSAARSVFGDD